MSKSIHNTYELDNLRKDDMMKQNSTEHISMDRLRAFAVDGINHDGDLEILEHISICDSCNERYVGMVEESLLELPADFVLNTMNQIERIKKHKVINISESRRRYYKYCVKVVFACACSIFILFNVDRIYQDYTEKDRDMGVTSSLQDNYKKIKNIWIDEEKNRYEIKRK